MSLSPHFSITIKNNRVKTYWHKLRDAMLELETHAWHQQMNLTYCDTNNLKPSLWSAKTERIKSSLFMSSSSHFSTMSATDPANEFWVRLHDHKLKVKLLSGPATLPQKGTPGAAGLDLYATTNVVILPGKRALLPLDIAIKLPKGTYGRIAPRSGLAFRYGIQVGGGVIDEDYRGNVKVLLFNHGEEGFLVEPGDAIAQLILEKKVDPEAEEVQELDETERGEGGFGSTGKRQRLEEKEEEKKEEKTEQETPQ